MFGFVKVEVFYLNLLWGRGGLWWRHIISLQLHLRALSSQQMRCNLAKFYCTSIFQIALLRWKHQIARCKQKENMWNHLMQLAHSISFKMDSLLSLVFCWLYGKAVSPPNLLWVLDLFSLWISISCFVFSPTRGGAAAAINSIDLLFPRQSLPHPLPPLLLLRVVDHHCLPFRAFHHRI